jgi:hypothetical protein
MMVSNSAAIWSPPPRFYSKPFYAAHAALTTARRSAPRAKMC